MEVTNAPANIHEVMAPASIIKIVFCEFLSTLTLIRLKLKRIIKKLK